MKEVLCEQGSKPWKQARVGKLTCSNFHLMRESARLKRGDEAGEYSSDAKDEAFRIAIERISGEPLDENYETWYMTRGHELEPDARHEHEIDIGLFVQRVGFIMTDDEVFGGSLDGVIEDDGSAEYKCFLAPLKLRKIWTTGDTSMVIDQVQGGLWISRRQWMDFCLYCPALAPAGKQLWRKRIYRDDDFIEKLESDLMEFKAMVDEYERILRAPFAAVEDMPAKLQKIARRTLPAPLTVRAAFAPSAVKPTEFERLFKRITTARNQAEVDLLLDGIAHMPEDDRAALRIAAAKKFGVEA